MGGVAPPILSKSQESRPKDSHAARELATVVSATFFCFSNNSRSIGQSAPPPTQQMSLQITVLRSVH